MIHLYHAPESRSTRMIALLEEIGEPYEIRPVSIFRLNMGEGMADPANPHPDKRVPAVEHEGQLLAESVAITLYLCDRFPAAGLAPAAGDPQRGEYLTWLCWYAAEMEPAMFMKLLGERENPVRRYLYDGVVKRLESILSHQPYLLGDRYSAADFIVGSALNFARAAFPESEALDAFAKRCRDRPSIARSLALDTAYGIQRPGE
ncbi:glutathione S-transferase family protein [Sphingopyxis sp. MWB1]|uniref:glutathione S-transferase family protein n=1 Tax=Sphingopyxis sp. MWB1 TaxID=1537715 RepID=UPI00051A125E|nr:glutathione S-transferase family protein [Sphingopyxis sp. MWB1]